MMCRSPPPHTCYPHRNLSAQRLESFPPGYLVFRVSKGSSFLRKRCRLNSGAVSEEAASQPVGRCAGTAGILSVALG